MTIEVVTKVPDPETEDGNLAAALVYRLPPQQQLGVLIAGRMEVFTLGEILVLDGGGREYGGKGRKPAKWDVETTTCATLEEAAELSARVSG